mgnify:CR=1 FL=1
MAIKFGRIDYSESSFEEQTFHKNQTVTSASAGVHLKIGLQNDRKNKEDAAIGLLTESGSHWAFVHTMFYSSGSKFIAQSNPDEIDKFNSIYHSLKYQPDDLKPFFTNKFHETASVFYIPQQKFGERIKPGTFQLTARTGSYTNTTKEMIIVDDKNGNLYSNNAQASQSSNTALSSSENYCGNVLYDLGIAILTETGSWSGSVLYHDIGAPIPDAYRDYRYWDIKFNSTTPIFTRQYSVTIKAGEFNKPTNYTARLPFSGSDLPAGSNIAEYANIRTELTTGSFNPYFTQIHLYRDLDEEPLLVANVPRPVQVRDDNDIIITFRVDQ